MKIKIHSYDLAYAVNKVAKAVAVKNSNPVLEGIKISAHDGHAVFTATDLELCIETSVECEVLEEGATVVVGKAFIDYVNKLDTMEKVVLNSNGKQVKVNCGRVKFALAEMSEVAFPKPPVVSDENSFTISSTDLKQVVGGAVFACANTDTRPILKGCLFEIDGDGLNVVGCDGFRIAVRSCKVTSVQGSCKAVIPARALVETLRQIDDDTPVEVFFTNGTASFVMGDTSSTIRLLNGAYVDYKRLINSSITETFITVDTEALLSALNRSAILANLSNNTTHCVADSDGVLVLSVNSDLGNGEEHIEVEHCGSPIDLWLNYKFLLDCLKTIHDEKVRIWFGKDARSPFFVRPVEVGNYEYMILPVRANNS